MTLCYIIEQNLSSEEQTTIDLEFMNSYMVKENVQYAFVIQQSSEEAEFEEAESEEAESEEAESEVEVEPKRVPETVTEAKPTLSRIYAPKTNTTPPQTKTTESKASITPNHTKTQPIKKPNQQAYVEPSKT
uniref:Uncharacterized protein n=1 Tax=Acrobeloides nanus TaxID=290746 RepID=A0A914CF82_9BILA